jgi:hypothetical protein
VHATRQLSHWALRDIKVKRTKLSSDEFLKLRPPSGGKADMLGGPQSIIIEADELIE